jgi:hypothetical protein
VNLVPFSYTNGPAGFVPAAALRSFQKKDRAVQDASAAQADQTCHDYGAKMARIDDAMRRILARNRTISRNGWHFFDAQRAAAIMASEAALTAYWAGSISASVASKPATTVRL